MAAKAVGHEIAERAGGQHGEKDEKGETPCHLAAHAKATFGKAVACTVARTVSAAMMAVSPLRPRGGACDAD